MKTIFFILALIGLALATSEWEVLFPDETWNKVPEKLATTFTGVLRQVTSDGMSITQRDISYVLETKNGKIDVYAPRSSLKQMYVNQNVDIKGRLQVMELEGSVIQEIFPSEIRLS